MTRFRFRPNLESMDERIVPNGAPVSEPSGPQPVSTTTSIADYARATWPTEPSNPQQVAIAIAVPEAQTQAQIVQELVNLNRQLLATLNTRADVADLERGAIKDLNVLQVEELNETANLLNATAALKAVAVQFGFNSPQYRFQEAFIAGIDVKIAAIQNKIAGVKMDQDRMLQKLTDIDDRISIIKCQIVYLQSQLDLIPNAMNINSAQDAMNSCSAREVFLA